MEELMLGSGAVTPVPFTERKGRPARAEKLKKIMFICYFRLHFSSQYSQVVSY